MAVLLDYEDDETQLSQVLTRHLNELRGIVPQEKIAPVPLSRPIDRFRGTGRTTRMLMESLKLADQGVKVIVVALDYRHADDLYYRMCQLEGRTPEHHFREYQWHSVGNRCGRYQIVVWDRQTMFHTNEWRYRLQGDPSQSPDVVLVDHLVFEMVYPEVVQMWSRFL